MKLSEKGARFIARHEGFVSRTYKDAVGVPTIGFGFTNRSAKFKAYWSRTRGHPLRFGDTIDKREALRILPAIADEEYGAAVNRHIAPGSQHEYDGATSACFNLGPGAARWDWGRALRAGDRSGAARALVKYCKAKGRRLPGLVRRRREEARLIETGDYGDGPPVAEAGVEAAEAAGRRALNREYQAKLDRLGYDPGPLDGVYGKRTRAAVLAFQRRHPDLVNDGLLGRATMAQIDRSIAKRAAPKAAAGSTVVAGAIASGAAAATAPPWLPWVAGGAAVLVVAAVACFVWIYRREL